MRIGALSLLLLTTIAPGAVSASSLIVIGDFEVPVISQGGFLTIQFAGEPSGFGWTVTTNSVDIVRGFSSTPFQGAHNLDLVGSGTTGGISQTFATTPGATYQLSFVHANNPGITSLTLEALVTVSSGGSTLLSSTIAHAGSTAGTMNWTSFLQTFVASGSTATLRFETTRGSGGGGIFLDAVSVLAVPEPSPSFLLASAALSFLRFNRRKGP